MPPLLFPMKWHLADIINIRISKCNRQNRNATRSAEFISEGGATMPLVQEVQDGDASIAVQVQYEGGGAVPSSGSDWIAEK